MIFNWVSLYITSCCMRRPGLSTRYECVSPNADNKEKRKPQYAVKPRLAYYSCVAHSFYLCLRRIVICFSRNCSYNSFVEIVFEYRFFLSPEISFLSPVHNFPWRWFVIAWKDFLNCWLVKPDIDRILSLCSGDFFF